MKSTLPRLVYIGDVPVEDSIGGSVALRRLLEDYPAERLLIIASQASPPAARLPRVRYAELSPMLARLTRTRLSCVVTPLGILTARLRAASIRRDIETFSPEAVLTVTHNVSWLTAAEVARRRRIPLFLVNHDCWFETVAVPRVARSWMHRQFHAVYAQASRRFCVSVQMAEYYRDRYGSPGEVLYPSRARDCSEFAGPPPEVSGRPFTLAYAGGIFNDCAAVLAAVAALLVEMNARLVIFSALPPESSVRSRLSRHAIDWRPFVASHGFIDALRRDADALLVIRERGMGLNAVLSFPSKIVDYTATGLPILLYAPADSAAAAWMEQGETGLFVEEGDATALRESIGRLAQDVQLRQQLGLAASARGREDFSHARVSAQFLTALREDARP